MAARGRRHFWKAQLGDRLSKELGETALWVRG